LDLVAAPAALAQCELLRPDDKVEWKVPNDLTEGKDISGAACIKVKDDLRRCMLVVDEGFAANLATFEGTTVRQDDTIRLAPMEVKELDAEGAAYDPATESYYVVGSHAKTRKKCDENPASYQLLRVPADAKTGEIKFDHKSNLSDPKWVAKEIMPAKTKIRQAMESSPQLGKYVNQCLHKTAS
jgi:hypothetical protein